MNYPQTLVLMDTDRIKEYIFASNRLKEIRGASLLLDRLNRSQSRALLQEHGGREIFIGGGGILATFGDAVQAKKYLQAVQRIYFQETEIASITGITEQITDPNDEQNALQRARVALRMAKGARLLPPLLGSSYFQICSSCNRHPVAETSDQERLCKACVKKREAAKMAPESDEEAQTTSGLFPDYTAYKKFAQRAEKKHTDSRWQSLTHVPSQLDQLEGPDTSYIGFIHADVNGLGLYLDQPRSLEEIHDIGHKVEEALELALVDAVKNVGLEPKNKRWPFLIIMMGGDDLMLIVPARKAVQLANQIALCFDEQISRLLGKAGEPAPLALSAGVVISKPKHPAYVLADIAEELTKSAKRLSHELSKDRPEPTVDFHILHSATANPIETIRTQEYQWEEGNREYAFTMRPYAARQIAQRTPLDTLIKAILKLREGDFPRNKLNQWADLIYLTELEQILAWETLHTRVSRDALDALTYVIEKFDLQHRSVFVRKTKPTELETPLLDLLELYEFVTPEGNA